MEPTLEDQKPEMSEGFMDYRMSSLEKKIDDMGQDIRDIRLDIRDVRANVYNMEVRLNSKIDRLENKLALQRSILPIFALSRLSEGIPLFYPIMSIVNCQLSIASTESSSAYSDFIWANGMANFLPFHENSFFTDRVFSTHDGPSSTMLITSAISSSDGLPFFQSSNTVET